MWDATDGRAAGDGDERGRQLDGDGGGRWGVCVGVCGGGVSGGGYSNVMWTWS